MEVLSVFLLHFFLGFYRWCAAAAVYYFNRKKKEADCLRNYKTDSNCLFRVGKMDVRDFKI